MVNFSDILGGGKKKRDSHDDKNNEDDRSISFSSLDEKDLRPAPNSQAEALHKRLISSAEKIFSPKVNITASDFKEISRLISDSADFIRDESQDLLEYVFVSSSGDINRFSLNAVNVCILSLEIALGLDYDTVQLCNLGTAAFFHDAGMRDYFDLFNRSKQLNDKEKQLMRNHPRASSDLLRRIKPDLDPLIFAAIEQEHERLDGSGYPHGLKGEEINEYAQIIGLADVYEALIYRRSEGVTALEAAKSILSNKEAFNLKLIKVFLGKIGLYPKGTFVELNTREVAMVVRQNDNMPSCPLVKVAYDCEGKKIDRQRIIDLGQGTKVYIVKSL